MPKPGIRAHFNYVHKQIRNVRARPRPTLSVNMDTSCAFRDDRAESGDIEGQAEGGHM